MTVFSLLSIDKNITNSRNLDFCLLKADRLNIIELEKMNSKLKII